MKREDMVSQLYSMGFRLGGSRRMAEKYPGQIEIKDTTDYDLYGQNKDETLKMITDMGFELKNGINPQYLDNECAGIYIHPECPGVDVLLRYNIERYTRVFESIGLELYKNYLWKSNRKYENGHQKRRHKEAIRDFFNAMFRVDEDINGDDYVDIIGF